MGRSTPGVLPVTSREGVVYVLSIACLALAWFAAHDFVPLCSGDCSSYTILMGGPVFSPAYWSVAMGIYRGYSVPILYSLFGDYTSDSAHAIVVFQALIAFVSWIAFALAIAGLIPHRVWRWCFFMLIASGMFSRGYLRFDDMLLSDSLALSFMLLWLVIVVSPEPLIDFARRRFGRAWLVAFLGVVAIMTSLTASARDANMFLIVCCLPIVMLRLPRRIAIATAFVILLVCAVQWHFSAERNRINMANIIAGVVLPDAERREFFAQRGMPPVVTTLRLPAGLQGRTPREIANDRELVLNQITLVRRVIISVAPDFMQHDARPIYAAYLLRHPRHVLGNIVENWRVMFEQHIDGGPAFARRLSVLDWIDVRVFVAIALVLLAATLFRNPRDFVLILGAVLAFAGFCNAVIGYHGDLWEVSEMGRHAWLGSTFLRLGAGIICLRALSIRFSDSAETR